MCHVVFPTKHILIKYVTLDHPEPQIPDQSVVELPLPKCRRQPKRKRTQEKSLEVNIEESEQSKVDAKKFKCALCSESFDTKIKRISHIGDAHKGAQKGKACKYKTKSTRNALSTCNSCGLKVCNQDAYIAHFDSHRTRKGIKKESNITQNKPHGTYCMKCEKDYGSITSLQKHSAFVKIHIRQTHKN